MPAIVSVKVVAARDLPVMDRSSESTDAFVEIRLGQTAQRSDICKKTLNPVWDSPWFQFNIGDEELQEEPLTLKVMDYDQYSAHDAIGRVYLLLAPLINPLLSVPSLDGWFPIYDTLHGIRGEIHIKVSIEVIKDQHKYKRSSSEVLLFSGQCIPEGYNIVAEHGFVEELVVNSDPEYQWIDKIRPPRVSNESRQRVFLKLTGELQRKIGRKALDMGGNGIIGFSQSFDLEGESGIVVRGIGTCVSLAHTTHSSSYPTSPFQLQHSESLQFVDRPLEDLVDLEQSGPFSPDVAKVHALRINRVSSSESDGGGGGTSSPTRGFDTSALLGTSTGSGGGYIQQALGLFEFPFYTLTSFPAGFIVSIVGIVSARSVKLLDDINNPDEPETRDAWWNEIRSEIRSHCRAMSCTAVIGYSETTSICDDLCILSATGTAAVVRSLANCGPRSKTNSQTAADGPAEEHDTTDATIVSDEGSGPSCCQCHVPFAAVKCPFDVQLVFCSVCRSKKVPSVLLSTIDPPSVLPIRGKGCFLQARICKAKRRGKGEENASNISTMLPFVEYGLHGRLLTKLKVKGMNSIFGLKLSVTVGDTMIVGVATGTAVFLEPLPSPPNFVVSLQDTSPLASLTAELSKLQEENKQVYQLDKSLHFEGMAARTTAGAMSPQIPSTPEVEEPEFHLGRDTTLFVEVDDTPLKEEDASEIISDHSLPQDFHLSTLSWLPGCTGIEESRVLTLVNKLSLDNRQQSQDQQCSHVFSKTLQTLLFRVRDMSPCIITNISFDVTLPEDDEIQISVVARVSKLKPVVSDTNSLQQLTDKTQFSNEVQYHLPSHSKDDSPSSFVLTPQNDVKGYQSMKHLGIINLFLIREATSIKELGGMGSFLQMFVSEAHSLASAQVVASGGQAMTNYQIRQCLITEHQHKNQGQCILNISGSAVQLKVTDPIDHAVLHEESL